MQRKLSIKLALFASLAVGLLAMSASSALAATATGGNGNFTAAAHVNVPPVPPCATYSLHNTNLTFTGGVPGATLNIHSDPDPNSQYFQWGEDGDGTYNPQQTSVALNSECSRGPARAEYGFTGTLTNPNGTVCTYSGSPAGSGTYTRNYLNLSWSLTGGTLTAGTGTCNASLTVTADLVVLMHFNPALAIGPFLLDDLTACNSLIAPTACALTNGQYT